MTQQAVKKTERKPPTITAGKERPKYSKVSRAHENNRAETSIAYWSNERTNREENVPANIGAVCHLLGNFRKANALGGGRNRGSREKEARIAKTQAYPKLVGQERKALPLPPGRTKTAQHEKK